MRIRETKLGKEFIFDNLFSKYRISKNDRNLTRWLKFKYNFYKKFKLDKFVKNKPWYLSADYHWNTVFNKSEPKESTQVLLTKNEIELKRIVIYDLLPKEYLEEFREKYCRFRSSFMKKHYTNRQRIEIINQIESAHNPYNFYVNLEYFKIKEGTSLKQFFDDLHVEIIGFTESFCIIKYSLNISSNAANLFEQISSHQIYKSPLCWSNDVWWKKNSMAGFSCYDLLDDVKRYVIEDFILELKSVFFKEIQKKIFSRFYNWKTIPPSVVVFSSRNLEENKQKIFTLFGGTNEIEYSKTNLTYFISCCQHLHSNSSSSILIADETNFAQNQQGGLGFAKTDNQICSGFSSYFVLDSLDMAITTAINIAERNISKTIYSKSKYKKLLSVKTQTDKNLFFYKRLLSEIHEEKTFEKLKDHISRYQETYENIAKNNLQSPFLVATFRFKLDCIFDNCENKLSRAKKIYDHFDENSKLIESKYNYKIVVCTLVVGFLTLAATVLAANNFSILKCIWAFVKEFFS